MNPAPTKWTRAALFIFGALICLIAARPAQAQLQGLDRVDSLIAAGEYAAARTTLAEWHAGTASAGALGPALQARFLFLRARLNTDPSDAERDYLALVLGHPAAPQTPAALLYLGQGLFARGDHLRAATYLERLARDYPTSPESTTGLLWLARVQLAAERPNESCATARRARRTARDPEIVTIIDELEAGACARAGTTSDNPYTPLETRPGGDADTAAVAASATPYALQAGAFRQAGGASTLASRLRQAGFEPRIVFVADSNLRHVRVGRYTSVEAANAAARTLRGAGFDVVVVNDAASERPTDP